MSLLNVSTRSTVLTENLPPPGVIAVEIVEDLEAALEQMKLIAEDLVVGGEEGF